MSAIVAIPARLKSTRFPRKVLADIHGRPMLWHVYQGVAGAKSISEVWVLTDSTEILEVALSWGARALMTPEECPSGTARIASVIDQLHGDILVNVQGDEPLITGQVVDGVVGALESSDAQVSTPVYPIDDVRQVTNPNVVKVLRDREGRALYFSRSPVPYVRDVEPGRWLSHAPFWGHVGVYAYRREMLLEYSRLPEGALERAEKLEQLRLLEAGKTIMTVEIDYRPHGVDVPSDLELVKRRLAPSPIPGGGPVTAGD
jgi:3-deoxy-manno-octulosonate cytidylyltransferase (CMP-KDO synthetase)